MRVRARPALALPYTTGTFRAAAERVAGRLRDDRDSLMAMLEAFVHDPLISWKLVAASAKNAPNAANSAAARDAAGGAAPALQ